MEVVGKRPCGFCQTGDHEKCPGSIAKAAVGKDWVCPCAKAGHRKKKEGS